MKTPAASQLAAFILTAALAVFIFSHGFDGPAMPMDEGVLLVGPELVLKGELPYRDFHLTKGPGNLAILSAAYSIFGVNIFVERAVGLAYRLVIVLAILGIARRWGLIVGVGCAAIGIWLLAVTDLMAHTWVAATAFALCSLWLLANIGSVRRCFVAGILASIAFSCRLDLGAAYFLATLPLFFEMKNASRKMFLLGGAMGLIPLIGLIFAIGFSSAFHSLISFPISQLAPGRSVAISSAIGPVLILFIWHVIGIIVSTLAAIVTLRAPGDRERGRLLLSAAIFSLLLLHYSLERFDWIHVLLAGLLPITLLPLSIFILLLTRKQPQPTTLVAFVAVAIAVFLLSQTLPFATHYSYFNLQHGSHLRPLQDTPLMGENLEPTPRAIFVMRNSRSFPLGVAQAARDTNDAIAEIEKASLPGQRLFVGPRDLSQTQYCDTSIYHLLPQLRPATYFIEMHPLSAPDAKARLARDIESADWLLLDSTWDFMSDNARDQSATDPATEAARSNFDLWSERGPFLLFRNKRLRNFVVPH